MNPESKLTQLYNDLDGAKAAHDAALVALGSCQVNTPGKCRNEAKRVKDAEDRIKRLRSAIRNLESSMTRYDGVRR